MIVLSAWLLHLETLNGYLPALARMKANTALCLVLAGMALLALQLPNRNPSRRRLGQTAAFLVITISLLTLSQYILAVNLGIDEWLIKDTTLTVNSGRMGYNAAISFMLIGATLLMLDTVPTRGYPPAQVIAPIAALIGALALVGYAYDLEPLYGITNYVQVSIQTAVCFILLSTAILAARPEQRLMAAIIAAGNRLTMRIATLVVTAVLLCGGVVSALLIHHSRDAIRAQIIAGNLDGADLAARFASRYIEAARMSLDYLGRSPSFVQAVGRNDFAAVTAELQQFLAVNRSYDGCSLFDPSGFNRATGNPILRRTAVNDREYFQQAMKTAKPYLGLPVLSRGTNRPAVPYAVPVLDDNGQIRAVLAGAISLNELSEAITKFRVNAASRTSLTDFRAGGIILAHVDRARLLSPPSGRNQAVSRMLRGDRDAMETTDSAGHAQLAAFSPVPDLPWGVLVLQSSDAAYAQTAVSVRASLVVIMLLLLTSAIISGWLAHHLTLPIVNLQNRATAIAAGDLAARANVQRRDELGDLGRAFDQMTESLSERTAQLTDANKQLEAFSYSVSHDLRAPLRAIDGFARILNEEHAATLSSEGRRFLDLIGKNAKRMGQLIDDMLAFARLRVSELRKSSVDPGLLARQTFEELYEQNGRKVDFVIGSLPSCQADPALLKQVWTNLISNALKFTGKRENARIEIGCLTQNGKSTYFIKDNGAGFDMRYADKLFGVFQRLHRFDEFEGTGVGLAIVQRVIQRHGGRIWAQSELDKGTTFYFTLDHSDDHD
ncbi:MAG TPA: cache domain-containing protein [Candidatus Binatia bacterium]